ncbi:MAG TPA: alginate lyase family protein [Acidimicrobiales bacterium]|nr:alginate lyase family protein [Acidimicrobiales bacterium]
MSLAWYARRLSRMSPDEVLGRTRDAAARLALRPAWRRRSFRPPAVLDGPRLTPVPLPAAAAHAVSDVARFNLLQAADELLAGQWSVFDRVRTDMDLPDWFVDPRTGRRAPDDAYCFKVNYRDESVAGNAKYVWELSRHHHLTSLAAAWYLSGDNRYADVIDRHLRSWWGANPFLSGMHWTSGIEVGIRLITWTWIRRLLDGWTGVAALFEDNDIFVEQLYAHQRYLATFPSHGSSANNHLLAEQAGQFVASCAFPWFENSARWRARAGATLRSEMGRQTFASGLNREMASDYHGFVLELCLAAAIEGEAVACPLGEDVWHPLAAMTDALAAMVDIAGRPPRQGDTDDGVGLLVDAPSTDRWASLLHTGAELFGPLPWWPAVRDDDVRTALWTSLVAGRLTTNARPTTRPSHFADAGMVLLRDTERRADELWCRVDHGPHGYLSIGAHGHADALSVELRYGGTDVLADPGTYTYHAEPEWRAAFRGTFGHNTIEVNGTDQSVPAGAFLWTRQAQAVLEEVDGLDDGDVAVWVASHDGYTRLDPPVTHRRAVRLDRVRRHVTIEDALHGATSHLVRLAFHLGPEIEVALEGSVATLAWPTGTAVMELPGSLSWTAVRAGQPGAGGWYSPHFGVRVPSTTLVGSGVLGQAPAITRLAFAPAPAAHSIPAPVVETTGA